MKCPGTGLSGSASLSLVSSERNQVSVLGDSVMQTSVITEDIQEIYLKMCY